MEFCEYLLGQGAGVPLGLDDQNTHLGLAGTWLPRPALMKT